MKTKFIWEVVDINPGKRYKDWNNRTKMLVCHNFNDNRGLVFNTVDEGWLGSKEWRTPEQMVELINETEGIPL